MATSSLVLTEFLQPLLRSLQFFAFSRRRPTNIIERQRLSKCVSCFTLFLNIKNKFGYFKKVNTVINIYKSASTSNHITKWNLFFFSVLILNDVWCVVGFNYTGILNKTKKSILCSFMFSNVKHYELFPVFRIISGGESSKGFLECCVRIG